MNDDYVKEILMDKKTTERGLFKKSELTNLFSKSNKNDPYDFNGKKIWMVMNIELWLRNYF